MKKFAFLVVLVFSIQNCWSAQPAFKPNVPIMRLSDVHAGMKGVAYTVFQGTKPEAMNLEVLGVLKNMNGPNSDVILIRLQGAKPEYTGVVAGMSGSPVYIDGKLVGALAFRIGEFSKEPIAGVTPIEQMLEINALDQTSAKRPPSVISTQVSDQQKDANLGHQLALPEAGPGPVSSGSDVQNFANLLKPIDTPLAFNGFTEDAVRRFAPQFTAAGITPVMGAGSVSDEKQPEPLVPGSAVSAVLVRGDLSIAATCTVTYVDPERLLACGHPLLQFGNVDIPMNKAQVVATLPSPENAFKIINTTEVVGAFVQDRHTGILGRFDQKPDMIPVTLRVHGGSNPKTFHYEVLNNPKLTPVAIMSTAYSVLQGINEYGEDVTYRLNGQIDVHGYPEVKLQDMYAPSEGSVPTAAALALSLGDRFGRIYDNQFVKPSITGVELDFDILNERRWARLESARTDVTEARPGDQITIEAALRPYRGERIVRQVPIQIPTSTPKGTLRILVSDADTLDKMRKSARPFAQRLDLASTIAMLNKERINDRLYVSLLEQNPEAMVQDKIMPTLPLSVMNVMEGMRGTQDMVVLGESSVGEESTPVDYVVSGAQVITITIK
jgi:SpoIVB peptidase S55